MTRQIATIAYALVILSLFWLNRDRKSRTSPALWLPVIWIFLGASRSITVWLGTAQSMNSPDQYLEGSPLDRTVYSLLLGAAIVALISRGSRTVAFLRANPLIILFLFYCFTSALWSDFPLVAMKRWTKALGNVAMVLIVLTDAEPLAAFKRLFARAGFFLIPISMLFIKYYPELGRGMTPTWRTYYAGVASEKNGLGVICLIWGLFSVWRFLEAYCDKNDQDRARTLAVYGAMLGMTLWLLNLADSSTSLACLLMGTVLLIATKKIARRRPAAIHALVVALVCVGLATYVFEDAWTSVVHSLNRQTDLTGRTDLWKEALAVNINRLVGTGFESFWLGDRARYFWQKYYWHPNQAHNGYIEMYLNLGWIGVAFLGVLFAIAYRNVIRAFQRNIPWASLLLAYLITAAIYNITEAAFKVTHSVYIAFLFAVIASPAVRSQPRKHAIAEPRWLAAHEIRELEPSPLEKI